MTKASSNTDKPKESSSTDKLKEMMKKTATIGCWTLKFDGSKSKHGVEAGFELISPKGKTFFVAHRLQFHYTNNVAEYESFW